MATNNSQSYQIDLSGRKGLAPRFWGDIDLAASNPNFRIIGQDGQMAEGMYNPFRRVGHMSAANTAFTSFYGTASTDYIQANWSASIYDTENSEWYMATDGRYLHKAKLQDGHTSDSTAVDLGNASYRIKDLEIYQVNGIRKVFVVYDKNGTLDVAISNLTYDTATDDLTWLTATVSGAFANTYKAPAFMRVADNGFAYFFNGNEVHKFDGTTAGGANGTVTANSLLFPITYRICDALDNRGAMYIAIRQGITALGVGNSGTTPCGVFVWDRSTTVASPQDFIQVRGVKDIKKIYISPSGTLRIMVLNADNVVQIREYNGNTFITVDEIGSVGGIAYEAWPFYHDSFTQANNVVVWGGKDGYIYAHGHVLPGDKDAVYIIGKVPSADPAASVGAILYLGGSEYTGTAGFKNFRIGLIISYRETSTTSDAFIKLWDMYGVGNTANATGTQSTAGIYTLVKFLPQMSTVKHIDIYMGPSVTSSSTTAANVSIYFNQSATAWATKAVTLADCAKGYKRIEVNKPYVNSVQLKIAHAGVTMGNDEFFPSFANVIYESTDTKG